MSAWTTHVTKYYKDRKRKDKNYSFKQAMKDAKSTYKRKEGSSETRSKKSKKRKTKRRRR